MKIKKLISLLICSIQIVVFAGCQKEVTEETPLAFTPNPETIPNQETNIKNRRNIIDSDIQLLVYSSVANQLQQAGFETGTGFAFTEEEEGYTASGLYYYDSDLDFFKDNHYQSVGFVEISEEDQEYHEPDEETIIAVEPTSTETSDQDEDILRVCTYQYDSIGSSHFVYKNQYITYYQQTDMRIVYSTQENKQENYDLSLGSLYDYDNKRYIYDETIFSGTYQTHSATGLFSTTDYAELEDTMQKISAEQEKNGYTVTEYSVVYISPENIQAYIDSNEDDTFFGYSVRELTETFGIGTTLCYTENGFEEVSSQSSNWKSFLKDSASKAGVYITSVSSYSKEENMTFTYTMLSLIQEEVKVAPMELLEIASPILCTAVNQIVNKKATGIVVKTVLQTALKATASQMLLPIGGIIIAGATISIAGDICRTIKNSHNAETVCSMTSVSTDDTPQMKILQSNLNNVSGYRNIISENDSILDSIESRDIDTIKELGSKITEVLETPEKITDTLKMIKNGKDTVILLAKNTPKMIKCKGWTTKAIL